MRSQSATTKPIVQRFFWGSVVALGFCLGANGCHSDQPAQSPSSDPSEEPPAATPKWSGTAPTPADPNEPEAKKGQFDQEQVNVVMARAAKKAHECTEVAAKGDYQGEAEVNVVFSGKGRSMSASLGELDQKQVGQCVIRAFVGIIIPPFDGPDMEMKYTVDLKPDAKVAQPGKVKAPSKTPPKASK
jgi:hypothetical protein